MPFWIWIIIIAVIVFGILPLPILGFYLYSALLVRTSKKKWGRECSIPDDEEYKRMFDIGIAWDEQYASRKQPVEIESDGLKLVGEYFDFGSDTSVIIIAGRMESLLYSYYFAEPYRKLGYNILVIDNRAHGLSQGRFLSLGHNEYRDILKWGELLHDQFHQRSIVIHGICIGSCVGLFALCSPDCPDYFKGIVAEGMFTTFHDSFVNHLVDGHHPIEPATFFVMNYIKLFTGADVVHDGPLYRIDRLKRPILFIHSKQDVFSLPEEVQQVYDRCQSEKKLVWFEKGDHSRVRINAPERYDETVIDFFSHLDI
ncbi:alpha/beta hydrolase [Ruminococcus sp.]|uniref:alpha/beta hydrolase n=1 Tax=Ruminococcus sp. TaxID=41978 RepID=UPI00386DC7DA